MLRLGSARCVHRTHPLVHRLLVAEPLERIMNVTARLVEVTQAMLEPVLLVAELQPFELGQRLHGGMLRFQILDDALLELVFASCVRIFCIRVDLEIESVDLVCLRLRRLLRLGVEHVEEHTGRDTRALY